MMRGDDWVRIPIFARGLVPIGVGSVKITRNGEIEITVVNGKTFGEIWYDWALHGHLEGLMLETRLIPAKEAADVDSSVLSEKSGVQASQD